MRIVNKREVPKHVAITFSEKSSNTLDYEHKNEIIRALTEKQVSLKIPIMTFHVLSTNIDFEFELKSLRRLLDDLLGISQKHRIRINVIGRWYDLPESFVNKVKVIIKETLDYDSFFVNLCINYDSKEELVDACKLIVRRVLASKLSPEVIDKAVFKENLYSSFLLEPDLIIKNGKPSIPNLLIWDSPGALLFFTKKHWRLFTVNDFLKALRFYSKYKKRVS